MSDAPEWDRAVFSVGQRQITISDVVRAGYLRHELETDWTEVCRFSGPHEFEPDEDAAQTGSEQFRSERDLITSEETEQWLEKRGLTVDDFSDFFVRRYSKISPGTHESYPAVPYDDAPEEMHDMLRVNLLVGGAFDGLSERLAWRMALGTNLPGETPADFSAEMTELEEKFAAEKTRILTPAMRAEMLGTLRQKLTRVELEVLELESQDAAQEALFCLRDDGETMAQVADDGGYPLRQREWWAGEVDADLQSRLLSASAGEVIGPIANDDEFQIFRLLRKIEPELSDETVSAQVDQHIVERHFAELIAKEITWIIEPFRSYA